MTSSIRAALVCGVMVAIVGCGGGGGGSGSSDVGPSGPALGLSATSVTIPATQAGGALPAAQTVYVTNSGSGTLATPTATPADAWLDATVVTSGAGYRLSLRPNTTALAPATRTTTVQVASAGATNSPRTVDVSWQVTAAATPVLVAAPAALTFTAQVGDADPASQPISLSNGGTGSLGALDATSDAAWLTPSLAGSTVTVAAALGALDGGDHTGHVSVTAANASNSPVSVPVTFHVLEPTISVSTTTMSFAATVGGATPTDQTRPIANSGTGTLRTFTATPSYTTGNGWLTTATVTGTGNARTLTVGVTPPGSAGTYDGAVTVASPNTTNGSVQIPVQLVVTVTPSTINASPTSLSFTMTAGTNPASQPIAVTNSGGGTLAAIGVTPSYTTGTGWISAAVTGSGNSQTVTVSIAGSPAVGSYAGAISIASGGASNSPVSVPVTLTVNASGGDTSTPAGAIRAVADASRARQAACWKMSSWHVQRMQASASAFATAIGNAASAGRVSHSKPNADACLVWLGAASCAELDHDTWDASCEALLTGHVANGASCSDHVECANGYCAFGSTCPGTCTAYKAAASTCGEDEECGPGSSCIFSGMGGACTANETPGGDGQACAGTDPQCAAGLFCDGSGTCSARIAAGGECVPYSEPCQAGLQCASDGAAGYRCAALAGEGQPCSATQPCGSFLYCSALAGSRCAALPIQGESCSDAPACVDGTYCLGASPTCTAGTVAPGGTCSDYSGPSSSASALCAMPSAQESAWITCDGVCVKTVESCF